MPAGEVATQALTQTMPLLSEEWLQLVSQFKLQPHAMDAIAHWPFADYILRTGWDVMASTIKIRQAGFGDCLDTEQMYLDHLSTLQSLRVLPS